ncbi:Uncharacterized conserved protein, DUF2164 family [Gracilibacillus orientalis]|uniref:Uncharacterized conserved protein, DUF2164 family n=1 Tax=Gracilibacillus orientalis TaxID=334253 RepID=A0A1I4RHR6_9BACI|nr:DUF2164 domain-containing protein [Gracilibacillus orientalis]SFM51818.1 Uncharacterized conserved protein, DUF2164 family [Gracilibacillus orientalis]
MQTPFSLAKEKQDEMINTIQNYFATERQEELGNLEAGFILDFIMVEIAPTFYNQGVRDAHQFLSEKLEDVFEIEKIEK